MTRRTQEESAAIMERVQAVMAMRNLDQAAVARALSDASGIRYENAKALIHKVYREGRVPRQSEMRQGIADALGVSPGWVWYGAGDAPEGLQPPSPQPAQPQATARRAPAMRAADTGPIDAPDSAVLVASAAVPLSALASAVRPDPAGYGVIVGPDLAPRCGAWAGLNDLIWLTPAYQPRPGDRVLHTSSDGTRGLYRLLHRDADGVLLVSPAGEPIRLPLGEAHALHRVAAITYS